MTASTATSFASAIRGRYLAEVFLHARSRSHRVTTPYRTLVAMAGQTGRKYHQPVTLSTHETTQFFGELVAYENVVSDFLAQIAPFAIEQLNTVARLAPGYDIDALVENDPRQVDELVRPIFEAAGIADDFIPWREAFPNYKADA